MAKRKPKVVFIVGTQTDELSAAMSFMEVAGIKASANQDEYGEDPDLRDILDGILERHNAWVFDTLSDSRNFELTESEIEDLTMVMSEALKTENEDAQYQDVIMFKDGRITKLLHQLVAVVKEKLGAQAIAGVLKTGTGDEVENLDLVERVPDICEHRTELVTMFQECIVEAKKLEKLKVIEYTIDDFPADCSQAPVTFFEDLHKAKLIKELPSFEEVEEPEEELEESPE